MSSRGHKWNVGQSSRHLHDAIPFLWDWYFLCLTSICSVQDVCFPFIFRSSWIVDDEWEHCSYVGICNGIEYALLLMALSYYACILCPASLIYVFTTFHSQWFQVLTSWVHVLKRIITCLVGEMWGWWGRICVFRCSSITQV